MSSNVPPLPDKQFHPTITDGIPLIVWDPDTGNLGTSPSYLFYGGIPYGADSLQYVNIYQYIGGVPRGTIFRIRGGSWRSTSGDPAATVQNPEMTAIVSQGYTLIDINYRGWNSDNGSNGNGQFPNSVDDIKTVLRFCFEPNAGQAFSPAWQNIYNYLQANGKPVVTGNSAGGHLAIMGVCSYGTESGNWPKAVLTRSAPLNLDYTDIFIDSLVQTNVINNYVTNPALLADASPFYQYGTASNPGPWFNAVNSSGCKFYFSHNQYDTLVTYQFMAGPTINNFLTYNSANTVATIDQVGPPQGAWPGTSNVTFMGATSGASLSNLPTSSTLGHAYFAEGAFWVYNNGTFVGDTVNPASVRGFTRWFDHNYVTSEGNFILTFANQIFPAPPGSNTTWQRISRYQGGNPLTFTQVATNSFRSHLDTSLLPFRNIPAGDGRKNVLQYTATSIQRPLGDYMTIAWNQAVEFATVSSPEAANKVNVFVELKDPIGTSLKVIFEVYNSKYTSFTPYTTSLTTGATAAPAPAPAPPSTGYDTSGWIVNWSPGPITAGLTFSTVSWSINNATDPVVNKVQVVTRAGSPTGPIIGSFNAYDVNGSVTFGPFGSEYIGDLYASVQLWTSSANINAPGQLLGEKFTSNVLVGQQVEPAPNLTASSSPSIDFFAYTPIGNTRYCASPNAMWPGGSAQYLQYNITFNRSNLINIISDLVDQGMSIPYRNPADWVIDKAGIEHEVDTNNNPINICNSQVQFTSLQIFSHTDGYPPTYNFTLGDPNNSTIVIGTSPYNDGYYIPETATSGFNIGAGKQTIRFKWRSFRYFELNPIGHFGFILRQNFDKYAEAPRKVQGHGVLFGNFNGYYNPATDQAGPSIYPCAIGATYWNGLGPYESSLIEATSSVPYTVNAVAPSSTPAAPQGNFEDKWLLTNPLKFDLFVRDLVFR